MPLSESKAWCKSFEFHRGALILQIILPLAAALSASWMALRKDLTAQHENGGLAISSLFRYFTYRKKTIHTIEVNSLHTG